MIRRSHRFRGRGGLRYVYQNGDVLRGQQLMLRVLKTNRKDGYRLAVVVSKKVSKSAVVRNRIRRRLYAALQDELADRREPTLDMILTVFDESLATISAEQLVKNVQALCRRLPA